MVQTAMALVLFLIPLAYSPGPGNIFFAANSARFGFWATAPANVGYHVATWLVTAGIGFGLMAAFANHPGLFMGLKAAGSLYVLWLAWKLMRAGVLTGGGAAKPATFADGVMLLVLNPKAYVIVALMFTQFLGPSETGQAAAILMITTVFTLNNLVAFSVWGIVGDRLATVFRSPESARKMNMAFGAMLAGIAAWMLLS